MKLRALLAEPHYAAHSMAGVVEDIRSLGISAPLRAFYELSKRVGGHRLLFEWLARSETPYLTPAIRRSVSVPAEAHARTIRAADRIAEGYVTLFGKEVATSPVPDWHAFITRPGHWPTGPWWQIDIRSPDDQRDIKWTWELGRHRHLVVLARAIAIAPERTDLRYVLHKHLQSWFYHNPVERGVHWYSNLEIAIRAIAWREVLSLDNGALTGELRGALGGHLRHAGYHITADFAYTLSSMRGNHLLGDALGLVSIADEFNEAGTLRSAGKAADRLFSWQLNRHVLPDGAMIEDSLSYHRFVLEMLIVRSQLPAAPRLVDASLVAAAQWLARLGALDGPVPQHGDWDEGRILVSTQHPTDLRGSVRLALACAGDGAIPQWRAEHDECAWYAEPGEPASADLAERSGRDIGGGMARAVRGDFTVWLKAGSGSFHGHGDLCSTPILAAGEWLVGDPGTGTYNGPLPRRNYFRSSTAHSVLRLGGEDQLGPSRAFRWLYEADGRIGRPIETSQGVLMWGWHNAYRRLAPSRRLARVVLVSASGVVISDWIEGESGVEYKLSIPLHPSARWEAERRRVTLQNGHSYRLDLPGRVHAVSGSEQPFDGWWSDTFANMVPATRVEASGKVEGPVCWAVSTADHAPFDCNRADVGVAETRWRIEWAAEEVQLKVDDAGHLRRHNSRL